ncbi:Crp/Fnr family transcriptional regulator [Actinosynnema sp. CS-041913]|uniref:Crp/Fnr family transcriptional regulator n=1 Tax=Actinosynnema sp. CS-041913 TaxID=3239917 RepID=UPI003D91663B
MTVRDRWQVAAGARASTKGAGYVEDDGLVARLPPDAAAALLALGERVEYATGETVFREGDRDVRTALLLTGAVTVRTGGTAAEPTLLGVVCAGDLVGEMAPLDGNPRSATVAACGPVTARLIPQHRFLDVLDRHRALREELARSVVARLRRANALRRDLPSRAETRVARVLVDLVTRLGHLEPDGSRTLDLPLTNVEVGSLAGLKRRSAEHAFAALREAGVVRAGTRRVIHVPDLSHLATVAAGRRRQTTARPAGLR